MLVGPLVNRQVTAPGVPIAALNRGAAVKDATPVIVGAPEIVGVPAITAAPPSVNVPFTVVFVREEVPETPRVVPTVSPAQS